MTISTFPPPGMVSGYFATIPAAWQSVLGGDLIVGMNGIPIVTRTSFGPAAFAVNSADLAAGRTPIPAHPLVYYDQAHETLGPYGVFGTINPVYNGTAKARGLIIVPGTSSALFFGSTGTGPYCYGESSATSPTTQVPGSCYDPANSAKGEHAFPYTGYVWAYDLRDFAAVRAGSKQPWEIVPYATWTYPTGVIGGSFDPATGRIFLCAYGDTGPVIHVLKVTVS